MVKFGVLRLNHRRTPLAWCCTVVRSARRAEGGSRKAFLPPKSLLNEDFYDWWCAMIEKCNFGTHHLGQESMSCWSSDFRHPSSIQLSKNWLLLKSFLFRSWLQAGVSGMAHVDTLKPHVEHQRRLLCLLTTLVLKIKVPGARWFPTALVQIHRWFWLLCKCCQMGYNNYTIYQLK